jgi:hypothetical protein
MIKRKARVTLTEKEAQFVERRAMLAARREALRASEDVSSVDRAQLLAEVAVVIADLETEIDQWRNVRAMAEAQERATAAGEYADAVVAEAGDD